MMSAPGWVSGLIADPEAGCPDMMKKVGVFALPGNDGGPAPVLLGGSNIAIAAKSPNQDLAKKAVALMLSDDYQTILAENGLTPAKVSLARCWVTTSSPQATIAAACNAKLTPAAPGWAASRAPASSRTSSSPSPTAATSRARGRGRRADDRPAQR